MTDSYTSLAFALPTAMPTTVSNRSVVVKEYEGYVSTANVRVSVNLINEWSLRFEESINLGMENALLSELALAEAWDTPEEDEAWRDL